MPKSQIPLHPRHDPSHPLLHELVRVRLQTGPDTGFDALLTRVPGIGEEINREDQSWQVTRVQHEPVNDDGRARFGWHAFVDAILVPPDPEPPRRQRKSRQ